MRAVLTIVLPLVLPLVLFVLWRALRIDKALPHWFAEVPWVTLLACGVVLSGLTLTAWSLLDRHPVDANYVPPRFEDGKVIPGEFK
jgi:hypothetical protein